MLAAIVLGTVPASAGLTIVAVFPAAWVDLRERRLPDVWVGAAAIVFLVVSTIEWFVGTTPTIGGSLVGAVVVGGPILLLHVVSPPSMGFGDVKAALVIGLAVGSLDWQFGLVALTLAAGSAATVGVLGRTRTIAFGPFLVFGGWLALVGNGLWLAPLADGGVVP
jgi:leader peptidase (prepilin peptidase)/N-methyltransferase